MTVVLLFAIVFGFIVVLCVGAALLPPGRRRDVLDWDPRERVAARAVADDEDLEQVLARHNRARVARGLPPEDEVDVLRRRGRE
jgi:hypothetical protein